MKIKRVGVTGDNEWDQSALRLTNYQRETSLLAESPE